MEMPELDFTPTVPVFLRRQAATYGERDFVVTPEAVSSDGKTGLAWVPDLQPLGAWDEAERKWRAGGG